MVTYEMVKNDPTVKVYIQKAGDALKAIGFSEHSFAHVCLVADGVGKVGFGTVTPNSAAVSLGGQTFFVQLIQISSDGLFRHVKLFTQLTYYHPFFFLEFFQDQIPSLCC